MGLAATVVTPWLVQNWNSTDGTQDGSPSQLSPLDKEARQVWRPLQRVLRSGQVQFVTRPGIEAKHMKSAQRIQSCDAGAVASSVGDEAQQMAQWMQLRMICEDPPTKLQSGTPAHKYRGHEACPQSRLEGCGDRHDSGTPVALVTGSQSDSGDAMAQRDGFVLVHSTGAISGGVSEGQASSLPSPCQDRASIGDSSDARSDAGKRLRKSRRSGKRFQTRMLKHGEQHHDTTSE